MTNLVVLLFDFGPNKTTTTLVYYCNKSRTETKSLCLTKEHNDDYTNVLKYYLVVITVCFSENKFQIFLYEYYSIRPDTTP